MLSEQQQRIMGYFIEEAKDHLNTIEQGLLNLQSTIADPEMVNELFRAAHSVKGGAAMLGLNGIQQTSHRLEDYFKVLQECPIQVDQKLETLFLRVFDTLQELLEHLQGPFGLTDDKADEVMSDVMPVFTALNEHLGQLVSQCGAVPPEDVDLGIKQPVAAASAPSLPSRRQTVSEESALKLVFQSDVPARLREMLSLFKQSDQPASREQLQAVCRNLTRAGEQFELPKWCELLELARQAIAYSDNSYRTLALTLIKDIKQAQELVLSGRSAEISCSESLRVLLPVEPEPADDLAALLASVDFDSSDSVELSDFDLEPDAPVTAAEADSSGNLFPEDSWFNESTSESTYSESTYVDESTFINESTFIQQESTLSDADLGFGEPTPEYGNSDRQNLEQPSTPSRFADHTGPEVGIAELNSLADLFEGEVPDLGMTWQEEVIIDDSGDLSDALDSDASSDFSDLLFDQDALDSSLQTEIQDDDDLSGLLSSSELFGDSSELAESLPPVELSDLPADSDEAGGLSESELSLNFLNDENNLDDENSSDVTSDFDLFVNVEVEVPVTPDDSFRANGDLENLAELFANLDEDLLEAESLDSVSLNQLDQVAAEDLPAQPSSQVIEPFDQLPDPFADTNEADADEAEFMLEDLTSVQSEVQIEVQSESALELDDFDLSSFELDDADEAVEIAGDRPFPEDSSPSDSTQDWETLQDSTDDALIDAFLHEDATLPEATLPELLELPEPSIETLTDDVPLSSPVEVAEAASDILFVSDTSPIESVSDESVSGSAVSEEQTPSFLSDPWDEEFEEFTQPHAQNQQSQNLALEDDFFEAFPDSSTAQSSAQLEADLDLFADPFADSTPPRPVDDAANLNQTLGTSDDLFDLSSAEASVSSSSDPELLPKITAPLFSESAEPEQLEELTDLEAIAFTDSDEVIQSQALGWDEVLLEEPALSPAASAASDDLLVDGFVLDQSDEDFSSTFSDSAAFENVTDETTTDDEALESIALEGFDQPLDETTTDLSLDALATDSLEFQEVTEDVAKTASPDLLIETELSFDSLFEAEATSDLADESNPFDFEPQLQDDAELSGLFGATFKDAALRNSAEADQELAPDELTALLSDEDLFDPLASESEEVAATDASLLDDLSDDWFGADSVAAETTEREGLDELDEATQSFGAVAETTSQDFSEDLFGLEETADLDFGLDSEGADALDFDLDTGAISGANPEVNSLGEAGFELDLNAAETSEGQDFSTLFGEDDPDLTFDAEIAAGAEPLNEEAFGFEMLDVGEDAGILDEAAFDFDVFGTDENLSDVALQSNSSFEVIAPTPEPLTDTLDSELESGFSSDLDFGDVFFGSDTDLEEIAGVPDTTSSIGELTPAVLPLSALSELPESNGIETETQLSDDFADLDMLLDESPSTEAIALETELDAELNTVTSDDFADLDALLGESADAPSDALHDSLQDPLQDLLQDDFADLNGLLDGQAVEQSIFFDDFSSDLSPISSEADDFADLDALLGDEFLATPSESSLEFSLSDTSIQDVDEFDDLEKLLEDADQTLGGPPTSKSARRPSLASNRRNSRRGGGILSDQTMRVSVKNLDNLNNLIGELVVNRNSLEQGQERLRQFLDNLLYQVQQLSDVGQRMRDLYERSLLESSLLSNRKSYQLSSPGNSGTVPQSSHSTGLSFDALEMDRFTGFHTLSQEMIELIVRVRESASDIDFVVDETDQVTRMFRQVTTQLQEGLTRSRMVPFAQTADRLPRAVRDISLKCGKQAELTIEGRETLIDKMILEQLYDPMTHLVNNAITHGVETPEERIAARKSPVGRITVRTFHQGNQTVISVTDDGAGINPQKVKAKALEKGLITPAESREMTELDVYDLLFHHGFSTKDRADDLSGRGIGMDVVRTSLNEIRGVVNIDSIVGKGTTFTIRLPLTLSISKALCCISNRARIAFPMDGVEDMLDVPKERIQIDSEGRSCILWRDTQLPFQPLSELLKYNRSLGRGSVYGGNQEEDIVSVVVLRSAGNYLALQVDQVLGEQEIVIKQLEGPVPKPVGVAGATVLGDGRIMPIADVLELIDLSVGRLRRETGSALWEKEQEPPVDASAIKTDPTVLIVDDSITVRELLSMTFTKIGYRVEQARDGQEAWEKLRSGLPCDLVFCDIEMPRMDGLELLSRIQKDPNLAHMPIAMLTSRGADRHRQMAIQLGAKGYFTKPYLEEALLDAAQRMLKGEVLVTSNS